MLLLRTGGGASSAGRPAFVPLQPIRPAPVQDLLPQPDQPREREQSASDHEAPLEYVRGEVLHRQQLEREGQDRVDCPREERSVDPARRQRHYSQPGYGDQGVVQPVLDGGADGREQPRRQILDGEASRHVGGVDRGEGEPVAAQLAILLARVAHPLHQALLVDPLDAARADARVEEGSVGEPLRAAHATDVGARQFRIHHDSANQQMRRG
jgi:hypothetical protein